MSRFIHGQQITTTTYGTVTHMPPGRHSHPGPWISNPKQSLLGANT